MTITRTMSLPFSYRAKGTPPRAKKLHCFEIRDYTFVPVPDVDDAGAPLAVILDTKGAKKPKGTGKRRQPAIRYRSFQGQLYRQILSLGEPVTVKDFQRDVLDPHPYWRRAISNRQRRLLAPTWDVSDYPTLGHWVGVGESSILTCPTADELAEKFGPTGRMRGHEDNRSDREAEAQVELASRLLIVGGEMWTRAGVAEPYWEVAIDQDGRVLIWLSTPNPSQSDWFDYGYPSFRLDRLDEVRAFADMLVKLNEGTAVAPLEYELELARSEALIKDDILSNTRHSLYAVPFRRDGSLCIEIIPAEVADLLPSLWDLTKKAEGGGVFTHEEVVEIYESIERLYRSLDPNSGPNTKEFHDDARLHLLHWSFERQVRPELTTLIAAAREQRASDDEAVAAAFP